MGGVTEMRKIFIPVLMFLMLISFVSCNLDNNGILWTGVNRYPSDDKDRNFIGYSEATGRLYYTTVNGLSEFNPANSDSNSERVLSSNYIFINNSPDIAWISSGDDKIIYVDDYVQEHNVQDFYVYTISKDEQNEEPVLEKIETVNGLDEGYKIIDTFTNNETQYVVGRLGKTAGTYSVSYEESTNSLTFQKLNKIVKNYVGSSNGLIWSKEEKSNNLVFSYLDKPVTLKNSNGSDVVLIYKENEENQGNQIKSVFVNNNTMIVLRYADDDTVYVYEGSPLDSEITLNYKATITEDLPNVVPSFINGDNLYFLKYNSARSSELYIVNIVNLEDYSANSYTTEVAGLRAEAFFLADGNVFILTKDKGVFRIDGTSVTPVPDLRRR